MPELNAPRTTPECKHLENIVVEGLEASLWDTSKREAALVALKRLRKIKCVKPLEYIMHYASKGFGSDYWKEIFETAKKHVNELS